MSKAFNRVGHSKLIADLHSLGILGTALAWFCSYLSCQVQSVKIGSKISSEVKCTRGYHKEVCWALCFLSSILVAYTIYYHAAFVIRNLLMISSSTHPIRIHMSWLLSYLNACITCLAEWLEDRGLRLYPKQNAGDVHQTMWRDGCPWNCQL